MRRVLLLTLLALAACTPSQDTAGTGTPTSDPADLAKLGTQIDKSDQRIAAAVTVVVVAPSATSVRPVTMSPRNLLMFIMNINSAC